MSLWPALSLGRRTRPWPGRPIPAAQPPKPSVSLVPRLPHGAHSRGTDLPRDRLHRPPAWPLAAGQLKTPTGPAFPVRPSSLPAREHRASGSGLSGEGLASGRSQWFPGVDRGFLEDGGHPGHSAKAQPEAGQLTSSRAPEPRGERRAQARAGPASSWPSTRKRVRESVGLTFPLPVAVGTGSCLKAPCPTAGSQERTAGLPRALLRDPSPIPGPSPHPWPPSSSL